MSRLRIRKGDRVRVLQGKDRGKEGNVTRVLPKQGKVIVDGINVANDDQRIGVRIVRKALEVPARQIASNAGEDGSVIVGKIVENSKYTWGYDAQTGAYGDLVAEGIIDPTKVVRTALQDAASIAGLLITTEAMVAEKPKKTAPPPTPPMDY